MQAKTVRELGAFVRAQRRDQGLTQAELARQLGVSRDWVVRLEQGHPRLEAQRVLDALVILDVTLDLTATGKPNRTPSSQVSRPPAPRVATGSRRADRARPRSVAGRKEGSAAGDQPAATGQPVHEDPFAYLTQGR